MDFPTDVDPKLLPINGIGMDGPDGMGLGMKPEDDGEQKHHEEDGEQQDRARQAAKLRSPVLVSDDGDVSSLAQVVAAAFFRLQASIWLIPSEIDRWRIYPRFFEAAYIRPAFQAGSLWCSEDRNAVAAWLSMAAGGQVVGSEEANHLPDITGAYFPWFEQFETLLREAHPTHRAHSFLGVAATNTFAQNEGYMRGLVDAHLADLDRQCLPAYLEAAEEPLIRVWERFGFQTMDRVILLSATGERRAVRMYPMWREPGERG